jgi:hypothetical protein
MNKKRNTKKLKKEKRKNKKRRCKTYKIKKGGVKHISLKNSLDNYIIGVNYEAGKIIDNIRSLPNCLAYANVQIAMDAPFSDRVASESVRSKARSELLFEGYNEPLLILKLKEIIIQIKTEYLNKIPFPKLIIQISRGRASISTRDDIIIPILIELSIPIENVEFIYGYRTREYYSGNEIPFVFLNYGMYGVLTNNDKISVGEICNPILSYSITGIKGNLSFINEGSSFIDDPKNILNNINNIKKIILFGIEDNMPFITPEVYNVEDFNKLIEQIK